MHVYIHCLRYDRQCILYHGCSLMLLPPSNAIWLYSGAHLRTVWKSKGTGVGRVSVDASRKTCLLTGLFLPSVKWTGKGLKKRGDRNGPISKRGKL